MWKCRWENRGEEKRFFKMCKYKIAGALFSTKKGRKRKFGTKIAVELSTGCSLAFVFNYGGDGARGVRGAESGSARIGATRGRSLHNAAGR